MRLTRLALPALLLGALCACSSQPAESIRIAPAAQQAQYQSFSIKPIRTEGHRQDLEQRFNAALAKTLLSKGYQPAESADLQVIYALGLTRERGMELKPVQAGGATFTQTLATEQEQARLVLRILDARTQAVLYQAEISRHLHNPDLSQERFDAGVAKLLADFPARR